MRFTHEIFEGTKSVEVLHFKNNISSLYLFNAQILFSHRDFRHGHIESLSLPDA